MRNCKKINKLKTFTKKKMKHMQKENSNYATHVHCNHDIQNFQQPFFCGTITKRPFSIDRLSPHNLIKTIDISEVLFQVCDLACFLTKN